MANCIQCCYRRGNDCILDHKLEGHCQDMGNGLWLTCPHCEKWVDNIPHNPEHVFDDAKMEIMCAESNLCGCHTMKPVIDHYTRAELVKMRDEEPLFFAVHYEHNFNVWYLMAIYEYPLDTGNPIRDRGRWINHHPFIRLDRNEHGRPYFELAREVIKARTENMCPHRVRPHITLDEDGFQWTRKKVGWICVLESSCNFGDECTEADYKYCYLEGKE